MIRELVVVIRVTQEREEQRLRDLERYVTKAETMQSEIAVLRQEIAVLPQQFQDHLKQVELWDSRRWGLIIPLIGAVFSLASGLIVTLARK